MGAIRVLVVDDDPRIIEMMPRILALHGYDVTTASGVDEAINLILGQAESSNFDVLISDLDMGHAADGFTVVHAMRRINPKCITFILTGFPAFASALEALRQQVDDYLSKPSDIPKLIERIEEKLNERGGRVPTHTPQRLSNILRQNIDVLVRRIVTNLKANPEISALRLTDEELCTKYDVFLQELADHLDCGTPNEANERLVQSASAFGRLRCSQGYSVGLLVESVRIVHQVINTLMYENLPCINASHLLLDLNKMNDELLLRLGAATEAFVEAEQKQKRPAADSRSSTGE